ncbi:hypothetical protein [Psychrobacter ciconiae]|uniref:hypothetical protein n=1 Tax=Psychrobacter ciconiae TaxID=1553449 RepID=UPI00191AC697|nr:hypothetical protein [Psychrobacter ciconiae]
MTLTEPAQSLEDGLEAKNEESENQASQEDKLGKKLEEPTSAASDESTNDLESKNKNAAVAADNINTNENSSVIQPHKPRESQTVSEDHDKVYVKDNVVLLSRDLPQSDTNSALSSDVAELKYEAERINEELSAAIDEVKKRNQQQIEHREHEKN